MKSSFVESSDSAYKFKKLIRESLGSKAAGILSNPDFQQAAAFGLLEFQDEEDQKVPQMSPEEMIRFFSKAATYHDAAQTPNPIKRISSKTDPHSEVPNEEMETVYKKLFGTSIDKDPDFKHFFESEQLDERGAMVSINGRDGYHGPARSQPINPVGNSASKDDNNAAFAKAAAERKRVASAAAASAAKNNQQKPTGPLGRIKSAVSSAFANRFGTQNNSFEETYKNFIAEYEAVLEENGIYEYDLDEATEFFIEMNSGSRQQPTRLPPGAKETVDTKGTFSGNGVLPRKKTTVPTKNNKMLSMYPIGKKP